MIKTGLPVFLRPPKTQEGMKNLLAGLVKQACALISRLLNLCCNTGFFFLSIRTRFGPAGAPFIFSTCGLLQIVVYEREFCLIYDTWPFIQSVLVENRIPKKGENRVLRKQVLAELRYADDFFGDFCLNTLYFFNYSFANRKYYS